MKARAKIEDLLQKILSEGRENEVVEFKEAKNQ